jgi:aldehyde dehydrogenase (NAD+)
MATGSIVAVGAGDVSRAVTAAKEAQPAWARLSPVSRGEILRSVAAALLERREDVADVVARETGKSPANARGETDAAASLGFLCGGGTAPLREDDYQRSPTGSR